MLVYLTTKENPIWLFLLPFGFVIGLVFMYFDRKKIVGEELAHWFELNPKFRKMQKDIEEIKCQVKK